MASSSMKLAGKVPLLLLILALVAAIVGAQEAPAPAPSSETGSASGQQDFVVLVLAAMASLFAVVYA